MKLNDNLNLEKILLLHGTKTSKNSQWMNQIAQIFETPHFLLTRPQFPDYFQENDEHNDQSKKLATDLKNDLLYDQDTRDLIITGKSLGAKVAVQLAQSTELKALVLLGYPMSYQTGTLNNQRLELISNISIPICIIQGQYDKYGSREVISKIQFNKNVEFHWIEKADHHYLKNQEDKIDSKTLSHVKSVIFDFLSHI